MTRNFVVIYKVNNNELYEKIFDASTFMGNGLYKMYLGGNKKSTLETISKKATMVVNRHKGLKISIEDVIELA